MFNPDANITVIPSATWYTNLSVYARMPINLKELKIPNHIVSSGSLSSSFQKDLDIQLSQELLDLPYRGSTLRDFISRDPRILNMIRITVIGFSEGEGRLDLRIILIDHV